MNLQLIVFLWVFLGLLIVILGLEKKLARSQSDCDVATELSELRGVRILGLEINIKDWRNLADSRAAELNEFQVKCDNLMADKVAGAKREQDLLSANVRLMTELKRKHRRSIVW